jgi:hypothetical protein
MDAKWGQNFLFCMLNRTECILFISVKFWKWLLSGLMELVRLFPPPWSNGTLWFIMVVRMPSAAGAVCLPANCDSEAKPGFLPGPLLAC